MPSFIKSYACLSIPPNAKPELKDPSLNTTRWHFIVVGSGLQCKTLPTTLELFGSPINSAIRPQVETFPSGILLMASQIFQAFDFMLTLQTLFYNYMKQSNNNQSKVVHLVPQDKVDTRKVIVVLQKANLQTALIRKKGVHVLLNGDDHAEYISKKLHRDPADFRPDITHQSLLTLLDSPLNKSGKLQVYVTTASNQVIKINSATRIPRTFKRFAALMAQLLQKLSVRAEQSNETLLKIVQSPVTNHIPHDSLKLALSTKGKLIDIFSFVKQIDQQRPIVFLVGAVAKGNPTMEVDYYQQAYCISRYPLSASNCLGRLTTAFQHLWNIV